MEKPIRTIRRKKTPSRFADARDVPAPSREEARRRIRSKPGFLASLSPEVKAALDEFDGPEVMGPPRGKR